LKKREGNGGSPVEGNIQESSRTKLTQNYVVNREKDRTTVRIRTKNNQYEYFEGKLGKPLKSVSNNKKD